MGFAVVAALLIDEYLLVGEVTLERLENLDAMLCLRDRAQFLCPTGADNSSEKDVVGDGSKLALVADVERVARFGDTQRELRVATRSTAGYRRERCLPGSLPAPPQPIGTAPSSSASPQLPVVGPVVALRRIDAASR